MPAVKALGHRRAGMGSQRPVEGRVMAPEPSRELVVAVLHHCFPEQGTAAEALTLLDSYAGNSTPTGRARVQLAMLKRCHRNLTRLRELARTDFRDVVNEAEYPEEMAAPRGTSSEQMAAIRRRDREQYEAWLAGCGSDEQPTTFPG